MASVASCPQCNHELLVPDGTDGNLWAKCPQCRAFFQIKDAEARQVPELLLVEPDANDLPTRSAATVADLPADTAGSGDSGQTPETDAAADDTFGAPAPDQPSDESSEAADERIDEWFRSARTLADVPPMHVDDAPATGDEPAGIEATGLPPANAGATIEFSAGEPSQADADFELQSAAEPPKNTWDDAEHMDRLLANINRQPADEFASAASPPEEPSGNEPATGPAGQWSTEVVPALTLPGGGKRRRPPSIVRTLATSAVAGVVGLALGYYALLWVLGRNGDFLNVAQYFPRAILPASLHAEPWHVAAVQPPQPATKSGPADASVAVSSRAGDSAEVQAGYTVPVDSTDAARPERVPVDATTAAAPLDNEPMPGDAARVAKAPSFTADELAVALRAAQQAQPGLVAGDLDDSHDIQRTKGFSYSLLCDLAQKATFVDAAARPDYVAPLQQQSQQLFRQTLADTRTRDEVARIVSKWIGSPHRQHGGVFFAGTVASQVGKGAVVECRIDCGAGEPLTILVPAALADRLVDASQSLGVVGWIVDEPAEQVAGYTGRATQAIWAGDLFPLD